MPTKSCSQLGRNGFLLGQGPVSMVDEGESPGPALKDIKLSFVKREDDLVQFIRYPLLELLYFADLMQINQHCFYH